MNVVEIIDLGSLAHPTIETINSKDAKIMKGKGTILQLWEVDDPVPVLLGVVVLGLVVLGVTIVIYIIEFN